MCLHMYSMYTVLSYPNPPLLPKSYIVIRFTYVHSYIHIFIANALLQQNAFHEGHNYKFVLVKIRIGYGMELCAWKEHLSQIHSYVHTGQICRQVKFIQ